MVGAGVPSRIEVTVMIVVMVMASGGVTFEKKVITERALQGYSVLKLNKFQSTMHHYGLIY